MDSIFNTFSADNLYQSSSELFDIEKEANEINYSYDPDADAPVNVVDPNYSAKEGKKKDKKGVSMKGPDFEIVVMASRDVSSTTAPRSLFATELSFNRMPDSSGLCSVWIVFFSIEVYLSIKVN